MKNEYPIHFGVYTPHPEITLKVLQKKLGFRIPAVLIFSPWGEAWKKGMAPFPARLCGFIAKNGSIPFIKWEPASWTKIPNKMTDDFPLKRIADGKFDQYLRAWALEAKRFKKTIWLSFAHEMNGSWYHWGKMPEKYKKALLHIYVIFKQLGVRNIKWVFCVNNYPLDYLKYIPDAMKKDKNVIIGIDGYNAHGIWGLKWKPIKYAFGSPYEYVLKRLKGHKIIIAELGCAKVKGRDKKTWIREAFLSIKKDFPAISSVIWFNVNKEADWRITSF